MTQNSREYLSQPQRFLHPLEPSARGSNYLVPDMQQEEFREMRGQLHTDLDCLDVEITRIQTLLNDLIMRRDMCLTRIEEVNSAIAPWKKLPTEVLAMIFLLCVSGVELPKMANERRREDPWHIGSVCSKWRHIAFNTQALWENLTICDPPVCYSEDDSEDAKGYIDTATQLDLTFRTLDLAREIIPLGTRNLKITIYQAMGDLPATRINILRDLIIPYSTQFKELTISCPLALLNPLISSRAPQFSALESLRFEPEEAWVYRAPRGPSPADVVVFADTPKLHRFTWLIHDLPIPMHLFRIAWAQLTCISIVIDVVTTDVHLLLSQCRVLENCRLYHHLYIKRQPTFTAAQHLITMSHLRTIHLNMVKKEVASMIIDRLILPSLISISVESPVVFDDFASLVTRSQCNLRSFTSLSECNLSISHFLQTISPTLEALSLGFELPNLIVEQISSGTLLPRLEWICYRLVESPSLIRFADLVNSRWGSTTSAVSDILTAYASITWAHEDFEQSAKALCEDLNKMYISEGREISVRNYTAHAPTF